VIHRDIKPGNLIVDANNRVRLVDFGIAVHKVKPGSTGAGGQQRSPPLGTPGYAPREQATGQETPLSDLYALGASQDPYNHPGPRMPVEHGI
jgi:serine/threonine-protein kinase